MTAPAYGSIGTYEQDSSNTVAFPVPAGVASGDIIVITILVAGNQTITVMASGFEYAENSPATSGTLLGLHVVWKRATGADTGTYDFTLSSGTYRMGAAIRYTGCVASGNPWDPGASSAVDSTNGTITPAVSITTAGPDRLLYFSGANYAGGAWTPPTAGGTWDERLDTGFQSHTVDDLVQSAAGGSGSVTATCAGSDRRIAWLGALIGTTASGSVPPPVRRQPMGALLQV